MYPTLQKIAINIPWTERIANVQVLYKIKGNDDNAVNTEDIQQQGIIIYLYVKGLNDNN